MTSQPGTTGRPGTPEDTGHPRSRPWHTAAGALIAAAGLVLPYVAPHE